VIHDALPAEGNAEAGTFRRGWSPA
jgi:hypothetical protein